MFIYFLGIKGTGSAHLASLLSQSGARVEGEDVKEDFFTYPLYGGFQVNETGSPLPEDVDVVIYSAAFDKSLPSFIEAKRRGLPLFSYPEYLSYLSSLRPTYGISGTHGKTTTSAVATFLLSSAGIPFSSIYGSYLKGEDKARFDVKGPLVVEACEYRDHYMLYHLHALLINAVDFDHPDFFEDLEAVKASFRKRAESVEQNGMVFINTTEGNVSQILDEVKLKRPDLNVFTFGFSGNPDFLLTKGYCGISVSHLPSTAVEIAEKEEHILSDYLGAALVASAIAAEAKGEKVTFDSLSAELSTIFPRVVRFPGVASRSEVVAQKNGITYVDEYAHHPKEIEVSLASLKKRYPGRRLVVFFMPHTRSRTKALFDRFVKALSKAPVLVIEHTYAARRDGGYEDTTAEELEKALEKLSFRHFAHSSNMVFYSKDADTSLAIASSILTEGDVFVTMGAGDNRKLIRLLTEDVN
jgi:UDP-N-acetylmuramate-alanine ligase